MPSPADREKALETALAQIDRQFGKGTVMRLGSDERAPVAVIPTGSIALDVALGVGGLPRGRIVEIYGPESSGKTTLTLHAIANAQRNGGIAAFIDAEHALDPEYAAKLGVDIDALLVSQPDTGEQALEIAHERPGVRLEVMRQQDRLRVLKVCSPGHDGIRVRLGLRSERIDDTEDVARDRA